MSSVSRVSQTAMQRATIANLQSRLGQLQKVQEQVSSGRRVNSPSDDPAAVANALRARSELRRSEQAERNRQDARTWLGTADTALGSASTALGRVRDLVIQARSGALSSTDREAIAVEVDTLRAGLLDAANTTYLGRPIFGGNAGGSTAYGPSGSFVGDTGQVLRDIGDGASLAVNVSGPEAFGTGPTSLFAVLSQISNDLRTNPTNLGTDLVDLDVGRAAVDGARGRVGAQTQRVESYDSRGADSQLAIRQRLSEAEDVDLVEAMTELGIQQLAYEVALAATQRVVQQSLVEFLR